MNKILIAVLAGALLLAGCGAKATPTALPATSTPIATAVATTSTKAPEAKTPETEVIEPGEESIDLEDLSSGLSELNSYKSVLSISFDGKDADGNPVKRSMTMEEWFISNPPAQFISLSSTELANGTVTEETHWDTIVLSDARYIITREPDGTESCMMMSLDDMDSPSSTFSPDTWGSIEDARYEGIETVNGVRAKHYVWSERVLADQGLINAKGETWLAVDGEYLVRQVVEGSGISELLANEGETGVMRWELNVRDANVPFEIKAPEDCGSAVVDLPIMPDAKDRSLMGDMIAYASPSAMEDVVAFYQQEMAAAGWEASEEPMVMEGFASLSFARDEESVSLFISWDEESEITNVMMTISQP